MPRIRTVKPEFFSHHGLYTAEATTKLPLRVAFSALWTVADREGRFKWIPPKLKVECLPYDDVDMTSILAALLHNGFILRYGVDGKYGLIPGFTKHQRPNNREGKSIIPAPERTEIEAWEKMFNDFNGKSALHLDKALLNLDREEGKGREGKGTGAENFLAGPCS